MLINVGGSYPLDLLEEFGGKKPHMVIINFLETS
jgi:hypothetical protein